MDDNDLITEANEKFVKMGLPVTAVDAGLGWLSAIREAVIDGTISEEEGAKIRKRSAQLTAEFLAKRLKMEGTFPPQGFKPQEKASPKSKWSW